MTFETTISGYGEHLAVPLPTEVARALHIREGDHVMLRTVDNGIIVERPSHTRLAARLETVVDRETETSAGTVGAESIP